MNNIKILDCTLRDGGYINNWQFGRSNIVSILSRLTKANIDIVECGFLEDAEYNSENSFFSNLDQIEALLPKKRGSTQYVAMSRFGNLNLNRLKPYDGKSINGIRVTFHEDEARDVIPFCKEIKDKGYNVYVQPVGTTSYTDRYLLELIELVNELEPYAFYIVDTLGLMRSNDVLRMFYLLDNNLKRSIRVGFHSHNNLQLSFSNSQILAEVQTGREIIIDSSVYGMGRGAGNLNTELIAQYLNMNKGTNYINDFILEIIDETINPLREQYTWGYSVPYYLAAINNCHPNYATYLMNRKTLTVKSISAILTSIKEEERELFNKEYISELYIQYQKRDVDDTNDINKLTQRFSNKNVLVLAPGPSLQTKEEEIKSFIKQQNPIVISVNFNGDVIKPDLYFFSNDKRFQKYIEGKSTEQYQDKTIITSNVNAESDQYRYKVNYSRYLNRQSLVNDNATLMLLKLLASLKIEKVTIAGFDGFQTNSLPNYVENELETSLDQTSLQMLNEQIKEALLEIKSELDVQFLTPSLYQ